MAKTLEDALVALVPRLLDALDGLERIARHYHPPDLPALAASLGPDDAVLTEARDRVRDAAWPEPMVPFRDRLVAATDRVSRAHTGLRAAAQSPNTRFEAYRALRQQYRALEALYPLTTSLPSISRFFIEPEFRDDAALWERLAAVPEPDTGLFHSANDTDDRGGFSVYVPEYLTRETPAPVVFALHGGAGHGRVFLWSWLREARTRGVILVAPTASGDTWSLMRPDVDGERLSRVLAFVRERWAIDPKRILLSGMSDGGTFTLLSGLDPASPFTHLAPVAAAFHPLLVTMTEPERLRGLPVYLVHGALDWMFPVATGRAANQALTMAGADVVYREIADLSHTCPRDENGRVLHWLMRV